MSPISDLSNRVLEYSARIARVPLALGQYSHNFGKLASLLTSMPVIICIIYYHLRCIDRSTLVSVNIHISLSVYLLSM